MSARKSTRLLHRRSTPSAIPCRAKAARRAALSLPEAATRCGQGGFVCGSQELIDYVNAFGRSRFFSCNLAPMIASGLLAGLRIVEREPELRAKLWSNVAYMRRRFAEEGIDIGKSRKGRKTTISARDHIFTSHYLRKTTNTFSDQFGMLDVVRSRIKYARDQHFIRR